MNVAIVGLGLIGGSMAKSIKNRTAHTVSGADLNSETMTMARMCGAIDAPLTEENLPQADLILVAIRPGAAIEWVRQHAPQIAKSAILVDLCGVKRTVVAAIAPIAEQYGFAYIGGHPMAGRERGGFTAATDDLYVGASMILTPDKRTDIRLLETLKAPDFPGGGYIGEFIMCSVFFPDQLAIAYPIAITIGNLVDPPATMINSSGDYVVSYVVSRFVDGKDWFQKVLASRNA